MPGVFDQKPTERKFTMEPTGDETTSEPIQRKVDFKSPEVAAASRMSDYANKTADLAKKTDIERKIDNVNQMLGGGTEQKKLEEEYQEMEKIDPDDLKLAEEMFFKGYAEKKYQHPNIPSIKALITSSTPDEINLVEEVLWELVRKKETEDGFVDMPESKIQSLRNIYNICLSYKGSDGKDIMEQKDRTACLDVLKRAIIKLSEYEYEGKIKEMQEFKDSIKTALNKRAAELRKAPTPIIDFLTAKRYEFNNTMYKIMNTKGIIPKS